MELKKQKLKTNDLGKCFVLIVNNVPVGCFVICDNDIKGYPDYNPNLACVCIARQYRGLGYSKILLNIAIVETNKRASINTNNVLFPFFI